jgi:head-tail adaptor
VKVIDPAKLRSRVTIERRNVVDNGIGGRKRPAGQDAWIEVVTVWAECLPLRGGEALANLVQRNRQVWRVTIRARSGIVNDMRLRWTDAMIGEVIGNIKSAVPNEARDGLVITAESGVPT